MKIKMKKLFAILLAVLAIAVCGAAFVACGGNDNQLGFKYELSDDGTYYDIVEGWIPYGISTVIVLGEYQGKPVKSVGNLSFEVVGGNWDDAGTMANLKAAYHPCCVVFSEGIEQIQSNVFGLGNSRVYEVELPQSLRSIGENAFDSCFKLTSITVPENVEEIGRNAFIECTNLVKMDNRSQIGIAADEDYYGLQNKYDIIYSADASGRLMTEGNYIVYDGSAKTVLVGYTGTEENIVLPSQFNGKSYEVSSHVFDCNYAITTLTVSQGVAAIGDYAFAECINLTKVDIAGSVEKIGEYAFLSCHISSLFLGDGIRKIGEGAFAYNYTLAQAVIPSSVTVIGDRAFDGTGVIV